MDIKKFDHYIHCQYFWSLHSLSVFLSIQIDIKKRVLNLIPVLLIER